LNIAVLSDPGKERMRNEDNYYCQQHGEVTIFAVADGMGGHQAGDAASMQAVRSLKEFIESSNCGLPNLSSEDLFYLAENTVKKANLEIYNSSLSDPGKTGMGTTFTVGFLYGKKLFLAHVGDSRAYRVKDEEMERLTRDHSVVEEMVIEGRLSPEEARLHPQRNVLTRALGTLPDIDVDVLEVELNNGEGLLFCTDGLTSHLNEEEIQRIIMEEKDQPKEAAEKMVNLANSRGGQDNITLILAIDAGRSRN